MKEQLLKNVENIVAKEEIAHYEQFHLLRQWFLKLSAADASENFFVWEKVKRWDFLKRKTDVIDHLQESPYRRHLRHSQRSLDDDQLIAVVTVPLLKM